MRHPHHKLSGFVLLIIIAMLGVLSFLAIQFSQTSQTAVKLSGSHVHRAKANLAARSGIQHAIQSALNNFNTANISVAASQFLGHGSQYSVTLDDTSGQININDGVVAGELEIGAAYEQNQINPWVGGKILGAVVATGIQLVEGGGGPGAKFRCNIFDMNLTGIANIGDMLIIESGPNSGVEYPIISITWNGTSSVIRISDGVLTNGAANRPWTIREAGTYSTTYNASGWNNLRLRRILNAYGDVHKFSREFAWPDFKSGETDSFTGSAFTYSSTDAGFRGMSMNGLDLAGTELTNQSDIISSSTGLGDRIIAARPAGGYKDLKDLRDIINNWGSSILGETDFFETVRNDLTVKSYIDKNYQRMTREIGEYANGEHPTISGKRIFDPFHPVIAPTFLDSEPPDFTGLFVRHPLSPININACSTEIRAAVFFAPCNVSLLAETALDMRLYGTGAEMKSARSALAVAGMQLGWNGFKENGFPANPFSPSRPSESNVQANRFMSLRDALCLAQAWDEYPLQPGKSRLINFEEFREFLIWYETWGREYERPLPRGSAFNHGYASPMTFFTKSDPWNAGFTQNCVSAMLPEFLSPIRRIPGYLGAPAALVSPTFASMNGNVFGIDYWSPSSNISSLIFLPGTPFGPSPQSVFFGSYKPEDFVFRSHLPKITFLPSDLLNLRSYGFFNLTNERVRKTILSNVELFKTKTFRTQADFNSILDSADSDILVGPEHTNQPASSSLGFIGLKDREDDVIGSPQISMNFTDGDFSAGAYFAPSTPESDPAISSGIPINLGLQALFGGSMPDDQDRPFLTKGGNMSSVSPFGGFRKLQLGHGHYAAADPAGNGTESTRFTDSMYWSLADQVNAPPPNRPFNPVTYTHNSFGQGLVTAWVRLPTSYERCEDWPPGGNQNYFAHTVCQLRLFDRYNTNSFGGARYLPITITLTVGYDIATEKFIVAGYFDESRSTPAYGGYQLLTPVPFDNNELVAPAVANSQAFLGHGNDVTKYKASNQSWRLRRAIRLKKTPECAAGSWHRVSMGWNTRFNNIDEAGFWIKLRDVSNVDSTETSQSLNTASSFNTKYPHFALSLGEMIHSLDTFVGIPIFSPVAQLDSCVDNFQAVFGTVPSSHLGGSASAYSSPSFSGDKTLRYNIDSGSEPKLILAPDVKKGSQLLHLRVRDYRPPDSNDNFPACDMEAGYGTTFTHIPPIKMTDNEQDAFYTTPLLSKLKIRMTWSHHKPDLDGDISTNNPLVNNTSDSWTEIPWVKEIQMRYVPPNGPGFINWKEE